MHETPECRASNAKTMTSALCDSLSRRLNDLSTYQIPNLASTKTLSESEHAEVLAGIREEFAGVERDLEAS